MVELYCSWCKGLPESKEALKLIKNSGLFAGMELSNTDLQADKILEANLKVSIHNPIREFNMNLDNENFSKVFNLNPQILASCDKSSLPFVSFHTTNLLFLDRTIPYEELLKNAITNLNFLDNKLSKNIIFETGCGFAPEAKLPFPKTFYMCTQPGFAKKILSKTNAGVLMDISHVVASASAHKLYNNYPNEIKDFFLDYLKICAKRTYEIHLNSTKIYPNGRYIDRHFPLDPSSAETQLAFELTALAIKACPKLEMIVLEVEPNLEPVPHAKLLIKQAQIVEKYVLD